MWLDYVDIEAQEEDYEANSSESGHLNWTITIDFEQEMNECQQLNAIEWLIVKSSKESVLIPVTIISGIHLINEEINDPIEDSHKMKEGIIRVQVNTF